MSHHYTRSTIEDTAYCPTCDRRTQHRVEDRRRGRCLEHQAAPLTKRQQHERRKREHEAQNPRLFEE